MNCITLQRTALDRNVTRGFLYLNGKEYAPTIEPAPAWKRGAIPAGRYKVRVTYSPRFRKMLPILENVPDFSGIRIHGGTRAEHTEGCICVPLAKMPTLKQWITEKTANDEEVYIDIRDIGDRADV